MNGFEFVAGIVGMCVATFVRGVVIVNLWAWFVAGQFGIKQIQFAEALGLSCMIALLTSGPTNEHEKPASYQIVRGILEPILALSLGWLYHNFL